MSDRDPFLVDNNIETFLIVRKLRQTMAAAAAGAKTSAPTTPTTNQVRRIEIVQTPRHSA
jgi:hypothetical protein